MSFSTINIKNYFLGLKNYVCFAYFRYEQNLLTLVLLLSVLNGQLLTKKQVRVLSINCFQLYDYLLGQFQTKAEATL